MAIELLDKYYSSVTLLSKCVCGDIYVANSRRTRLNVIARVIHLKSIESTVTKRLKDAYEQTKRIDHANIFVYTALYLDDNTIVLEADTDQQTVVDDLAIRKDLGTSYTTDELFYFAYQIADALYFIHCKALYEALLFSVRADSVIIKGSPINLMDMKVKLSILTAKWPAPAQFTTNGSDDRPSVSDIFELSTMSFEQHVIYNITMLGHLLLEMALMRPLEEGTADSVCAENEELVVSMHNNTLLELIRFCLDPVRCRRTIMTDIKDYAAFGLGLRCADKEFRFYSIREKASTVDKLIKQLQVEKRFLSLIRARDIISQALTMATMAYNKGLALSYYAEDVNITRDILTIYPDASVDGHIYDLLRDIITVIEPGVFTQELSKLINVKIIPSLHDVAATLEPLLAKIGTNQLVKLTVKEIIANELAGDLPEDTNRFTIIYAQLSDQDISPAEVADIVALLPELIYRPVLLSVLMRCCVEKSVSLRVPFRLGALQPAASRLMILLTKGSYSISSLRDQLHDLGQQCLAPIGLVDRNGCKVFCTHLTALMIAAWYNKAGAIRLLLGELGYCTASRMSALMFAAIAGSLDSVSLLTVEAQHKNSLGQTALMLAAMRGHVNIAKLLAPLEAGLQDDQGRTALMYAVQQNNVKMVQLLADHEPGYQDIDGKTALMYAVHRSSLIYTEILCRQESTKQAKDRMTALLFAVRDNKLDLIYLLLPLEVSLTTATGETVLMYAVQAKNEQLVRQLINLYPDTIVGHKDTNGWTALMKATQKGYEDIAKLLLPYEGGQQTNDGTTALMIAARNCSNNIVIILREKESTIKDRNGDTALIHAAWRGNVGAIQLLKDYEAGVLNNDGYTALMIAIKQGYVDLADELFPLEYRVYSYSGLTAALIAHATQNQAMLQMVIRNLEGQHSHLMHTPEEQDTCSPVYSDTSCAGLNTEPQ